MIRPVGHILLPRDEVGTVMTVWLTSVKVVTRKVSTPTHPLSQPLQAVGLTCGLTMLWDTIIRFFTSATVSTV